MDPSAVSPEQPGWHHHYPEPHGSSALLVNALRKWNYSPVALPAKEYMEGARKLWEELELPPLKPGGDPIIHYTTAGYSYVFILCAVCFALGAYLLKNVRGVK